MTAARCMLDYPKDKIEVVVGTNDFWSGGTKYKIDKYINHENYNETSFANDISLILVNKKIEFGKKVGLVKLPTEDTPGGLDLIIAGFGYADNYHTRPKRLQKLTVKSLTVEECQEKHKKIKKWNPITDKLLCTYKDIHQGICQGDSGGALVHNGTVHGITSWNIPCARRKPDVFTRVYKYLHWISTIVEKLPIPT
ncbi:chymotrypsin-2-like [Pieris rapae]|uniref:chymotrypsin-2-like n=1 Tax=Pieris rapae TaxID=64459 RepID=UPI001E280EF0|nr:chymotrypsin-2-like [Pieris rapae]